MPAAAERASATEAVELSIEDLGELPSGEENVPIVALDQALDALSKVDERQGRIVEMKFFGGLSAAGDCGGPRHISGNG